MTDPGHPVDLYITTDARTLVHIWNGDTPLRSAIADGRLELHGATAMVRDFTNFLQLNLFAGLPRATN